MEPKYFPDNLFDEKQKAQDVLEKWYSGSLSALQEPSLFELSKNEDSHTGALRAGTAARSAAKANGDHPLCISGGTGTP